MHLSSILLLVLPLATLANPDGNLEATRLMILLKDSIDLQQIDALSGFTDPNFSWNSCKAVLDYGKYVAMLKLLSHREPGDIPAISTDWTVGNAHFIHETLYFDVQNKNRRIPDWFFEAKKHGKNKVYVLTRGKLSKCGRLEEV
ncbi:hypothetical protein GCK72_004226 [Caenorhabditis remanei]|uniref:Uncharacterized protein n=1 Tax=Caenorhabditis remanei TaxID=31234 RepID=A0A6A5HB47_CAERE|nr:hypothetical protein GCK72_004226 [Caenorhabditis remanei]KAF1764279.1 hypothetical protein GCK72_004226 [Caenorhabditis remanei]